MKKRNQSIPICRNYVNHKFQKSEIWKSFIQKNQ